MAVGVIIVAGGRGQRLGGPVPKQLLDVGGRSILQRSVLAFDGHEATRDLVVVLPRELVAFGPSLVGPTTRPCQYVVGGDRRQDSVQAGLAALPADIDIVLVHDAARPFVSAGVIDRVVEAAERTGAAVPALRAHDTVKRVAAGGPYVAETIPRADVWLAQTPQGFSRAAIESAVALGALGVEATDEAMLAEQAGQVVEIVQGDERNMKITTADDLMAARAAYAPVPRVGTGYDLHRLVPDRPLVLAGVTIPFGLGPHGHSDGDVVCHALCDALLGAAVAGDIGQHFSNTDPQWSGAPGLDLLARTLVIVGQLGWRPASVDVTVILERPKLGPHLDAVRAALATALKLDAGQVSVKAKTNEGVDATGRGEAIAAHAVAVLVGGERT
jgi:2-C-methyl-D-erythritol 4-phosphate cytidylyltransferase / 2-C-methyl-D-erythritol 2,4-cyclodiphosphate synthase